jgi:NADH dehydrogenase
MMMEVEKVCVIGGSGFVGRHLCQQLVARGIRVVVPTRDRERAKALLLLPTVDVVEADAHHPAGLAGVVAGCDAVINLVGVLHDGSGHHGFRAAHVELARNVVEACRAGGVKRLLQMSALGASLGAPSDYLRSKAEAERIVLDAGLDITIFRPSVIFGPDDSFLNLFADLARMVSWVSRTIGCPRPIIGLNRTLSYCQAFAMELLPVKLMTRDNVRSMEIDNISDSVFPFGIRPQALEALAPSWLATDTPRTRYDRMRSRAGR